MVAKGARDDYYAELLKLFLVSDTQIGKTPPSAEQVRMNEEQFQSDKQTTLQAILNMGHLYLDGKYFERLSLGYF
jgi:hypothetical protein